MSTLVVLAAGLGKRYGGVKQLQPVGPSGETLFDYALFDAQRAGCRRVVFVIRADLRATFEAEVVPHWRPRLDVRLAEQDKPLGTAHALLSAAAVIDGDMLVCNADDFYGASAYRIIADALRGDADTHVVAGYPLGATLSEHGGVSRAVCQTDANGFLDHIEERVSITRDDALPPDTPVSMNLWGFHPSFLPQLEQGFARFDGAGEFRIPDFVNELIRERRMRVRVLPVTERWFGMTYPADLPRVREALSALVRGGIYPRNLFASE